MTVLHDLSLRVSVSLQFTVQKRAHPFGDDSPITKSGCYSSKSKLVGSHYPKILPLVREEFLIAMSE